METPDRVPGATSGGLFRMAAMAVAVLVAIAVVVSVLLFRDIDAAITREVAASLESEAASYRALAVGKGDDALAPAIDERGRLVDGGMQLLVGADGKRVAGNLAAMPTEFEGRPRGGAFNYVAGNSADGSVRRAVGLLVHLPGGGFLVLARDIERQIAAVTRIRLTLFAGFTALALAGLAGGLAASRRVLNRVEAVNATARSIMSGDLTRRIPVGAGRDEIDELAHNLNRMLDRIDQLMGAMREVSDNIAHDLKTPLNRLRNRAEAALRDASGDVALRDGLQRVIDEADDLIKVFNAMLLIARLEAGALEGKTAPLDLGELVRDVAELYEPVAEEAGLVLAIDVGDGLTVDANRQLVGQAVANLVDNAIKYSVAPVNGSVNGSVKGSAGTSARPATRVSVAVAQGRTGTVDITVADDGPGIASADRERVLKRFVRLEQSRSLPGTGLGLSLVAAVARLHNGTLRLEDNEPGLRIVLALPASGAARH